MEREIAETLVRRAMVQAARAADRGDAPFGAVLATPDGLVLLEAANAQATHGDPTAHAEIELIRDAAREIARATFDGLVVATNAECCSMCGSALVKARVASIVFGAPHEGHMDPDITLAAVQTQSRHRLELVGPILADACRAQISAARDAIPAAD